MTLVIYILSISIVLPILLLILMTLISFRTMEDREKKSPFECGFDPNHAARVPFSTRFFLLAVLFLVFDIEIVLLMPIPFILANTTSFPVLMMIIFFLVILLIGLIHELNEGSLEWLN